MFNFLKEKSLPPRYIQNNKPENVSYKIVTGKDLRVGDIIVHNHHRCLIKQAGCGRGSGSFDFGEYVFIKAEKLTGQVGFLKEEFWTFQDCPVILEE